LDHLVVMAAAVAADVLLFALLWRHRAEIRAYIRGRFLAALRKIGCLDE
jgi:hypothetical protein